MPLLEISRLSKNYGHHCALRDVSLSVERGRILGLLGPNGAGKSTLLRLVLRLLLPDEGSILFDHQPLRSTHLQHMGYLPEERGLYPQMGVAEQLIYLARLKGCSSRHAQLQSEHWMERLELTAYAKRPLERLSKGTQQKVQFAAALVHEPQLLILDEPFSGFDPLNVEVLKNILVELKSQGRTIVYSTHNLPSAEDLCDDIALLHQSRLLLHDTLHNLRQQFRQQRFLLRSTTINLQSQEGIFDLLSCRLDNGIAHYELRAADHVSTAALIRWLADHCEILSFAQHEASLHEIFRQNTTHR